MSLPTPIGNPLPFGPDHPLFDVPENQAWLRREHREGETVENTLDRMAKELTAWYHKDMPFMEPFDWRFG
jgi:hypothetical protein